MALLSPLCPTVLTQRAHMHAQLHTGSHVCTHTLETRYKGVNSDMEGQAAMAVSHHHLGPPVTGGWSRWNQGLCSLEGEKVFGF